MPGLLKQGAPANVNANALEYVSETGQATYTGNARLFQDATSISGDMISVDRERGDLLARGSARSTLNMETGRTTGSAHEIRYVDTSRTVTYSAEPVAPTRGRGVASVGPGRARALLSHPHVRHKSKVRKATCARSESRSCWPSPTTGWIVSRRTRA